MNNLKTLLIQRINHLKQLHTIDINNFEKFINIDSFFLRNKIGEFKKLQKFRSIKESELLTNLNSTVLNSNKTIEQLYEVSVEICIAYDYKYSIYSNKFHSLALNMQQKLKKLYLSFFSEHGLKENCKVVFDTFSKNINQFSPSMLLAWLSEWSKNTYREILEKLLKYFSEFSSRSNRISEKFIHLNRSIQQNQISSKSLKQDLNNPSKIFLNVKEHVYGYFVSQLVSYYKIMPMCDLDITYLRKLKKMGKKQDILLSINLSKAIQVLCDNCNAEVKGTLDCYRKYFQFKVSKTGEKKYLIKQSMNQKLQNYIKSKRQITENQSFEKEKFQKDNLQSISMKIADIQFNKRFRSYKSTEKVNKQTNNFQKLIKQKVELPHIKNCLNSEKSCSQSQNNLGIFNNILPLKHLLQKQYLKNSQIDNIFRKNKRSSQMQLIKPKLLIQNLFKKPNIAGINCTPNYSSQKNKLQKSEENMRALINTMNGDKLRKQHKAIIKFIILKGKNF